MAEGEKDPRARAAAAGTGRRLVQLVLPMDVETLLRAAINDNDVEYMRERIGEVEVLSSVPLPQSERRP